MRIRFRVLKDIVVPIADIGMRLLARYLERLGPELVFVRDSAPKSVARAILDALRRGRFIIGATDLFREHPDTVEVVVFGQRGWVPAMLSSGEICRFAAA